jgi:uncharacterized protein (TIGR02996 family)
MDNDLRGLLAACRDTPDDDLPRLALADWCLDRSEPDLQARGEFIRAQVQLSRLPKEDPRYRPLYHEIARMERRWRRAWLGELRSLTHRCGFERGLLAVQISGGTLARTPLNVLAKQPAWPWVVRLTSHSLRAGDLAAGADSRALAGIACLEIDGDSLDSRTIRALAAAEARPRVLKLSSYQAHDAALSELAGSPCLDRVAALHLAGRGFSPAGLAALLSSDQIRSLIALSMLNTALGPAGARVLAGSAVLPRVSDLNLWQAGLGNEGMQALTSGPTTLRLERLGLANNDIASVGVRALAGWAGLSHVCALDLRQNLINDAGAQALAGSPHLGNLKELRLDSNAIRDRGALALVTPPALPRLVSLSLVGNPLRAAAHDELQKCLVPHVHLG